MNQNHVGEDCLQCRFPGHRPLNSDPESLGGPENVHFIFLCDSKRWDDDTRRNIRFTPTNSTNPCSLIIHVVFLNPWVYGEENGSFKEQV